MGGGPAFEHWREGCDFRVLDLSDDAALLFVTGSHTLFRIAPETAARLRQGLSALTPKEAAEWNSLVESGWISEINTQSVAAASVHDGADLAINVNLTAVCNLACTYCFADGGDYGRIKGALDSASVDHIFAFIARHLTATRAVRFEYFGGEPLLNAERIFEICERAEAFSREHGVRFHHRISTNLTTLPARVLELFADHRFIVSVSIDGGRSTHDRNRPGKGGQGSFDRVMANSQRVREASDEIVLVARMTVYDDVESLYDNVVELWNHNIFDYFQIYPAVIPPGADQELVPTLPGDIPPGVREQFVGLMERYPSLFRADNRFRGLLEIERLADMILQGKAALSFCSGGRNYFTFSPDRSIMPCHRLVGERSFQAGTAGMGLLSDLAPWRLPIDEHPVCGSCWVRYICAGGCKQENFAATGDLNQPNPELCRFQMNSVETVARMLGAHGRSYHDHPREILDRLFVSCGRPVIKSNRTTATPAPSGSRSFHPI